MTEDSQECTKLNPDSPHLSLPGQEMEKAASEVLKVLGNETGKGIASIAGNAFGGLFGDKIRDWRTRNMIKTAAKTKLFLDQMGIPLEKTKALPLGEFYQLFEEASKEDAPDLANMWSKLLASAMSDTEGNVETKRHIKIIQQLSPGDASLLQSIDKLHTLSTEYTKMSNEQKGGVPESQQKALLSEAVEIEAAILIKQDKLITAISRLIKLDLLRADFVKDLSLNLNNSSLSETPSGVLDVGSMRGDGRVLNTYEVVQALNLLNEKINYVFGLQNAAVGLPRFRFENALHSNYEFTEYGHAFYNACCTTP